MNARCIQLAFIGLFGAGLIVGCGKVAKPPASHKSEPKPVATVHWVGKNALAKDKSATGLMDIWNLPESKQLEQQILDKLALALWGDTKKTGSLNPSTNYSILVQEVTSARLLRPLLNDLLEQGCHLAFTTNVSGLVEIELAIRLDDTNASVWTANLAGLQEVLLKKGFHSATSRDGEWTLVRLSTVGEPKDWGLNSDVLREAKTTNWLSIACNPNLPSRLSPAFPTESLPALFINVSGDVTSVLIEGNLQFTKRLDIHLDPWLLPTNLMQHPLVGLTSVRGIAPTLKFIKPLSDLQFSELPNQLHVWHRYGPPVQFFFALPASKPEMLLNRITPYVIEGINPNAPIEKYGMVQRTNDALLWAYFPYASPNIRAATNSGISYLMGGFGLHLRDTNTMPQQLLSRITNRTNLLYFDWEVTGERIQQFRYLDDVARMALDARHRPRLLGSSASLQWLGAVLTNHLQVASTEAYLEAPDRIRFNRKSQVGLTAVEINLLLNWFESPEFPSGFMKFFEIDPTPPPPRRPRAN